MKTICNEEQKAHLEALIDRVKKGEISAGEAWTAFSVPAATKKFKRKDINGKKVEIAVKFALADRKSYKDIRAVVAQKLFAKHGKACIYCRRPVGHYGWSWHIEHVLPKSIYPTLTFDLENLAVGCVNCNMWKGVNVDKTVKNKTLPIINPLELSFDYSMHLQYLQISTEKLSFAKYKSVSPLGTATHKLLHFEELERFTAVNSLDGIAAGLNDRMTRALSTGMSLPNGDELVTLISDLRSAVYHRPKPPTLLSP